MAIEEKKKANFKFQIHTTAIAECSLLSWNRIQFIVLDIIIPLHCFLATVDVDSSLQIHSSGLPESIVTIPLFK